MTITKFQGRTESEAIEKAKKEMGPDVVIMSVKTVKPKGVFRAFKGIAYEVTAALEENELDKVHTSAQKEAVQMKKPESINLTADENIRIPVTQTNVPEEKAAPVQVQQQQEEQEPRDFLKPPQPSQSAIEERLDSLQSLLEDRISAEKKNQEDGMDGANGQAQEGFSFVKMLYQTLLDNEVDEKYANQILDEL